MIGAIKFDKKDFIGAVFGRGTLRLGVGGVKGFNNVLFISNGEKEKVGTEHRDISTSTNDMAEETLVFVFDSVSGVDALMDSLLQIRSNLEKNNQNG